MYNFDYFKKTKNSVTIKGWAFFDKSKEPLKISIYGKDNSKLSEKDVIIERNDVVESYPKYSFNKNCGFLHKFDFNINEIYKIKFKDSSGNSETIDRKEFLLNINVNEKDSNRNRYLRLFIAFLKVVYKILFRNKLRINKEILRTYFNSLKKAFYNEKLNKFSYYDWILQNQISKNDLEIQKKHIFKNNPLISIITPTYNTKIKFLDELINSLKEQTYTNWELCIADGSDKKDTKERLEFWENKDKRIKVKYLYDNMGIIGNSNEAIELSKGEYLALLDHDDLLEENALFEVVKCINNNPNVDYIYTDEDKINEEGDQRFDPFFKPDWSPDALRSYNYLCHFSVIKKDVLNHIGEFREGFEGSQDYDLFLRITDYTKNIIHIPQILYHWRAIGSSTALDPMAKGYVFESSKKALKEHLERIDLKGDVEIKKYILTYKINFNLVEKPLISIIIPNKDHLDDLKLCIDSILNKTTYDNYEIIIVENNSETGDIFKHYDNISKNRKIKVVTWKGEFNYSAINNFGVEHSEGKYLVLLNNDIEIITNNWLEEMLSYNQRNDVGIVGCKLYFNNDTIQHAGVILGINNCAGHAHRDFNRNESGYANRLKIVHNLSAVTAACMMIKREVFKLVKGLDEEFKVAFNDVDFCLKVRKKNYLIVFNPYVEMYHYESKSRGYDDTVEKQLIFQKEMTNLRTKWKEYFKDGDPYYNKNLSLVSEDFGFRDFNRIV